MFQQPVDRFRGAISGAGKIEVRRDAVARLAQSAAQFPQLFEPVEKARLDGLDQADHDVISFPGLVCLVAVDGVLVGTPGGFEGSVVIGAEHCQDCESLLLDQQRGGAFRGPTDPVQGVPGAAAMAQGLLLEALPELVELRAARPTTWNRSEVRTFQVRSTSSMRTMPPCHTTVGAEMFLFGRVQNPHHGKRHKKWSSISSRIADNATGGNMVENTNCPSFGSMPNTGPGSAIQSSLQTPGTELRMIARTL